MRQLTNYARIYFDLWRRHGSIPPLTWVHACRHLQEGNYPSAAQCLNQGLTKHTKHAMAPHVLVDLARCAYKEGELFQVQYYLLEAIRLKPSLRVAHLRLCALASQLGDWMQLCDRARTALAAFPNDAEFVCLLNIGAVALDAVGEDADDASVALSLVQARTARDELFLRVARAVILIGRGEYGRAVARLRVLTQAVDSPLIATICLCRALLDSGHPLEARLSAREALRRFPGDLQLLTIAIESYLVPGSHFNAEYALDLAEVVAQRTSWQNPHAMILLARSYLALDDRMAALAVAQRAYVVAKGKVGHHAVVAVEQLIAELDLAQVA